VTPKIAIIGAGPAGLLAAYAVQSQGCEVSIYAPEIRDGFLGAQVLHRAIPGLTGVFADAIVHIAKWGKEPVYRRKVYGSVSLDGPTSWDEYQGTLAVWNMHTVYSKLLDILTDRITIRLVKPAHIPMLARAHDAIINTAPAKTFCEFPGLHVFPDVRVNILVGAADGVAPNQIVYNGTDHDEWYRSSRLFGFGSTEYGDELMEVGGTPVRKPLWTDCTCHLGPRYYRAGRYGRWQKGVLVHDGYETGMEVGNALYAVQ
jgi:NAD(P)-binding Rossmann-like domain